MSACPPDFLCVEYDFPGQANLRAIPLLRRDFPALPVLMLTEYHSESLAVWALRPRVWDYRVKPISAETLSRVLRALADLASGTHLQRWPADNLPADLIAPAGHLRKPARAAPRTATAIAFVHAHYGETVRVPVVAQLCHLSGSEFSRRFHYEHNVSFRRFLLNYRIAMARDFPAEPLASVSQVAYAAGFNDLSHFSRVFKRLVGEPARHYHQLVSLTAHGPHDFSPQRPRKSPT